MPPQRTTEFCTTVGEVPPPLAGCPSSAPPGFRSDARRGLAATAQHTASPRRGPCGGPRPARSGHAAWNRTTASVDAPFHNPTDQDSIEIEVTDSRHPLFGRRLPLVSVSARRSDGYALVAYRGCMLLKLPVAATSLAPRQPYEAVSKLTREALEELIALADECGVAACRSDLNASGDACPANSAPRSSKTSPRSSRR